MDFPFIHSVPNSYSRELDNRVAASEMPYGYEGNPPPADTNDYNTEKLESKKEYRKRGIRG